MFDLKTYTWNDDFWDVMESLSICDYNKVINYLATKDAFKLNRRLMNIIYVCYMRGILPVYNFDNRSDQYKAY